MVEVRPYRWLAERSVGKGRRKLIHRESFRASVLHLSEIQAVLQSIAEKRCLLTTPSFLSMGTRADVTELESSARRSMRRNSFPAFFLMIALPLPGARLGPGS